MQGFDLLGLKPGEFMLQKSSPKDSQIDIFRSRLENMINLDHKLVVLSQKMNWQMIEERFGKHYSHGKGRPGIPIRVMVGLHYLKYMSCRSDEEIVADFIENPYYQYFCGMEYFVHKLPCHPSLMGKFRKKIGHKGAEKLLTATIELAMTEKMIDRHEIDKVYVDTFVQEKNITFPTDGKLYNRARIALVKQAKIDGIELRQSYTFNAKRAIIMSFRYSKAKQFKRARKQTKNLKNYLGRVMRDIQRKATVISEQMEWLLRLATRIFQQKKNSKNKLYSLHAPEVRCIGKGKAHKPYEFGNKVSLVTSAKSSWILGLESFQENHYDGHTLYDSITQMRKNTGEYPNKIFCDKGYKGVDGIAFNASVIIPKKKSRLAGADKRWLRRRSRIEAVISHLKFDHRMDRNFLKGAVGDKINAFLAASAFNLRKIMRNLGVNSFSLSILQALTATLRGGVIFKLQIFSKFRVADGQI